MALSAADKYLTVRESHGTGFWRGVGVGVVLSFLAFAALAILVPPEVYTPPSLAPEAVLAPGETGLPVTPDLPPSAPPRAGSLLVAAPAPLLSALPPRDAPPGLEAFQVPAAPDIFDGGPAGSPSLFDPAPVSGQTPALR